jgi:hypothetical protein
MKAEVGEMTQMSVKLCLSRKEQQRKTGRR